MMRNAFCTAERILLLCQKGSQAVEGRLSEWKPHPFSCPCWEIWQDQCEGAHEHARQLVDDRQLLKDGGWVLERRQECYMSVPYPRCILDKDIREAVCKCPAHDGHG